MSFNNDYADTRYVVVFDCESDSSFNNLPGNSQEEKLRFMQFTVACAAVIPCDVIEKNKSICEILLHTKTKFWWRDAAERDHNPIISLLDLFDGAEVIVGYNCLSFDFPLLKRFYCPSNKVSSMQRYVNHRSKTLDIMNRVRDATGSYYKLDQLLKLNKLKTKSSNGLEAIKMWERNEREELKSYCEMDVLLTAQLSLIDGLVTKENLYIPNKYFGISSMIRPKLCDNIRRR